MRGLRVALLAEQRWSLGQHSGVYRAVWRVADSTVLGHRRMLPKQRTALILMTGVAGFIRAVPYQHIVGRGTVRVVTIRTGRKPFADRVTERFIRVRALLHVAVVTNLRLRLCSGDRIVCSVDRMTVGTCQVLRFMHAAGPVHCNMSLVTFQAHTISLGYRAGALAAEIGYWRTLIPPTDALGMITARSVAGLALQLPRRKRRTFVATLCMGGFENRQRRLGIVTTQTGVGTATGV
jgi:hypothetical protein